MLPVLDDLGRLVKLYRHTVDQGTGKNIGIIALEQEETWTSKANSGHGF